MTIDIPPEDVRRLLAWAHIGYYLATAVGEERGESGVADDALQQHLFRAALADGRTDLVEEFEGHLVPTDAFDKQVHTVMDDYADVEFWDRLENDLARRDFIRESTGEHIDALSPEERVRRVEEYAERYADEFSEHGLEHVEITHEQGAKV